MSTEMIKRVADAIQQSFGRYFVRKNKSGWGEVWEVIFTLDDFVFGAVDADKHTKVISSHLDNISAEDQCEELNKLYLGRAAITAMLEPTEEMLNIGYSTSTHESWKKIIKDGSKEYWQNMIKRALQDG